MTKINSLTRHKIRSDMVTFSLFKLSFLENACNFYIGNYGKNIIYLRLTKVQNILFIQCSVLQMLEMKIDF